MFAGEPPGLYALLRQQAERLGDAVALRGLSAADLSYRGFIAQTERIVETLAGWGIGRGDRVMIQVPNGPEAFMLMIGVSASAVAFLLDPGASPPDVEHFMRFTEPKAIIVLRGVEGSGRAAARQLGVQIIEIVPTPQNGAGVFTFVDAPPPVTDAPLNGPDDLSLLVMTSGTTAMPKLVPKTQRALHKGTFAQRRADFRATGTRRPLHVLSYVPLHLAYGRILSASGPASGGSVTCLPGFDPQQIFQWIDTFRPNFLSGLPVMLDHLVAQAPQHAEIIARHSLGQFNSGGTVTSTATSDGLRRVFGVPVVKIYAMTEVDDIAMVVIAGEADVPVHLAGQAEDAENIGIIDSDGRLMPPGETGEIVVRDTTFTGYWHNPAANADAMVGAWFRTGDEGSMDARGNLSIVGRVKEVINSGGAKVSPHEVEVVLKQHPQVRDAAVFGLKNADMGETVAAVVVGDVTERELRKFAAERLPFYKVPTRIIKVDKIPLAASGKIQRNRLAELLGLT